jgi:hypothetical protein
MIWNMYFLGDLCGDSLISKLPTSMSGQDLITYNAAMSACA